MPITQILLTANSGPGGGIPNAYAGYGANPVEGGSTTVTITVENWPGDRVYWTVVGKGSPAADPSTDMTGTLSGFWDPGVTSFAQTVVTTIGFVASDGTEGTEYWGVDLGSSPGANDFYSSGAWPIQEPVIYTPWTIEWWHKSNPTQPAQFPRVFGVGSYPNQEIGFSLEGVYYAWVNGSAINTTVTVAHNVWQHWVMVSNQTTLSIYKDGTMVVTIPRSTYGLIDNISDDLFIGKDQSVNTGFKGLITNFRVVKGQAMYDPTQNTITVPTIPLWSNSNTELLLRALDSGNLITDSSNRNRISVGSGSNAFSSDTPFTAPTPASPVIITQGQSWNPEVNTLYISRATFPDVDSVQTGWSFVSDNYTATVISAVTEFDLRIIVLSINSGVMDGAVGTFTQYQVGGSIEMYTSNAGYVTFDNGREWAFDLASSTYTLTPAANNVDEGSSLEFTVGGTNIINGTYYWTISGTGGPLTATNGSFTITDNAGSFTVTPEADLFTEGSETFTVSIRSYDIFGTVLATSESITINDTSLTVPTYTWGSYNTSINEGDILTINVNTTGVADGTTLYWNVLLGNTLSIGDFNSGITSDSFTITSNTGSFNINPASDTFTEDAESFTVQIRTGSNSGTVVLTSDNITINDTSSGTLSPIAYTFDGSGSFTQLKNRIYSNISYADFTSSNIISIYKATGPQPQVGWQIRLSALDNWRNITDVQDGDDVWTLTVDAGGTGTANNTAQLSDNKNAEWALGTTWTIEFWIKPDVVPGRNGAPNNPPIRILSQNTDINVQANNGYNNLDICLTSGIIAFANQYAGFEVPAEMVGVWSHVAISSSAGNVKGFINGVLVYNYAGLNVNFTNGASDLYIGKNGTRPSPNVNAFSGELTDIHISSTARYTSAFDPTTALSPTRDANTKLLLTPKQNSWYGSETVHDLSYSNQVTVDYPTP